MHLLLFMYVIVYITNKKLITLLVTVSRWYQDIWSDLHDERCACGNIGFFGLQLTVGVVEAVPGRTDSVDDVCMDYCEVGKTSGSDAQHAQVIVQRRSAVFDLDALFLVIHGVLKRTKFTEK
ncbi:hypothetical protein XENORESO_021762 [Xenotaenia resolanae]|uniref:Uncharacterized protein n=1 Tax=Xenotaenia resolanae TaxID=208358 RepID=A0ABV0WHL6_9TELE